MKTVNVTSLSLKPSRCCYVAHFDILGTSALIENDIGRAWNILCDLKEACAEETLPIHAQCRDSLEEYFFSDTVILVSSDDSTMSLHTIIARSLEIFREAWLDCIPLRGGIACGETISDRASAIFTGKALLSAYRIGERQQSLTICLDKKTAKAFLFNPFTFTNGQKVVLYYELVVKNKRHCCKEITPCLNWPALCHGLISEDFSSESIFVRFSCVTKFRELVYSVKNKYKNTFDFVVHSKSQVFPKEPESVNYLEEEEELISMTETGKANVENLLNEAIRQFLCFDSSLLKVHVNERAISHKLAIYIEMCFPCWDVDCEYNRNHDDPKRLNIKPRSIQSNDLKTTTVLPDIIVHKRGTDENFIVIEMKKDSSSESDDNYDLDKLRAFKRELGYKFAIFMKIKTVRSCDVRLENWIE